MSTNLSALLVLLAALGLGPAAGAAAAAASPMNSTAAPAGYHYVALAPAGREFLHGRVLLPDDFSVTPLPEEEHDFSQPTKFMPLGVAMTAYGPLVFAAAARPAYEDGTVSQWLTYLCEAEGYAAGTPEVVQLGKLQGVAVDAVQQGDGITMKMRLVLVENGGRLFQLTAMAPAALWPAMEPKLKTMVTTLELNEVLEPRAALFPGAAVPGMAATAEPTPEPATPAVVATEPAGADAAPAPTARLTEAEFAELVLAPDHSALDPDQKINANLRDRGVGLTARILAVDETKQAARVGVGAIQAVFTVPFGWHVIDDGRRTLVFDGGGRMQISLSRRPRGEGTLTALGQSYVSDHLDKQPDLPVINAELDGLTAIVVKGIDVDGEVLDQAFFLRELPGTDAVMVARVTAKAEDIRLAMNLAGDIMVRLETEPALVATR